MTLSKNQVVLLVILAVVATGVWVAIRWVDGVFKERERQEDLIKEGRTEELVGKPAPRPPGPPPLERATTRGTEVVVVLAPQSRKAVVIRGNGDFVRLPLPAEPGPVVTGSLDRAMVDDLARSVTGALSEAERGGSYSTLVVLATGKVTGGLSQAGAQRFLELTGKAMNRSAVPESVQLQTAPGNGDHVEAWPFPRNPPDKFLEPSSLAADSDRARFRAGLLRLLDAGVNFSHAGKTWRVVKLHLIP